MKPSIRTLGEILYSPSQYVIPVFQRNYRWEEPQWAKLWESLVEIQQPTKRGNHFMGFLVFVPGLAQPGQHNSFHLIDGQQRLTTVSLLLAALRNVAREAGQSDFADEIHSYYLVHPLKRGEQHYRLLPKERDHDSYLALISDKGAPSGRTADAVAWFEARLSGLAEEDGAALRAFFDTVCQRLEFMCATLEAENAYNIFKSLNSTGVPLGPSDLIRNFVFMHVPPDEQDRFDQASWAPLEADFATPAGVLDEDRFSRFFRDFLMSHGRYVPPKDTFATFEARYEATGFSPSALAEELTVASTHYRIISGQLPDQHPGVTEALQALNALEASTTYPLVLSLFLARWQKRLSSDRLTEGLRMLSGFILRRFITGESSRGYGQVFVRGVDRGAEDPVEALEDFLMERGWPDDTTFTTAFVQFPLYQRGYPREVLEALERARGHKEPAALSAAQIEHVMPQTLTDAWRSDLGPDAEEVHAAWLHRLGNLTLSAYNQELWNHPFSTKRARYASSNIVLTREIADLTTWGPSEIELRGQRLAVAATRIWVGPSRTRKDSAPEEGGQDALVARQALRSRFWNALQDSLAEEYPDLPDLSPRPFATVRLASSVRHIGVEARLSLRHDLVGVDVWFWREESFQLWERLRVDHGELDGLIGDTWQFERVEGRARGRMLLDYSCPDVRDPATWPRAHRWMGTKLHLLFQFVLPRLRQEMAGVPSTT